MFAKTVPGGALWRLCGLLAVFSLMTFAGGCVTSVQPILTDKQVMRDEGIPGSWVSAENSGETIEVVAVPEGGYTARYRDKDGKIGNFRIRIGMIGEMKIAEIAPAEVDIPANDVYKAHLRPVFSFLWITQSKPELRGRALNPDWLRDYLKEHPGELQAVCGEHDVLITSPTADIQAFLLRHHKDKDAFGDEARFVRPKGAAAG